MKLNIKKKLFSTELQNEKKETLLIIKAKNIFSVKRYILNYNKKQFCQTDIIEGKLSNRRYISYNSNFKYVARLEYKENSSNLLIRPNALVSLIIDTVYGEIKIAAQKASYYIIYCNDEKIGMINAFSYIKKQTINIDKKINNYNYMFLIGTIYDFTEYMNSENNLLYLS